MPTFLTTNRMSTGLRRRVQASVTGRENSSGARLAPRSIMCLRAVAVVLVVVSVTWLVLASRRANHELEQARAQLLERWRVEASPLSGRDRSLVERVQPWLGRAGGKYAGDWIAPSLRGKAGDRVVLSQVLSRAIVYLRGPLPEFASPASIEAIALNSVKDAFVLCLLDPPGERTEKLLLRKVRSLYGHSASSRQATQHVVRLGDALLGLPLLGPDWSERIAAAEDSRQLEDLKLTLDRAPLDGARRAAQAALLLLLIDEPGDTSVPAELDGERPHPVRVHLVDLESNQALLRLRRRVDPSWLTDTTRAEHAHGVDSCSLALDVHEAVAVEPT